MKIITIKSPLNLDQFVKFDKSKTDLGFYYRNFYEICSSTFISFMSYKPSCRVLITSRLNLRILI